DRPPSRWSPETGATLAGVAAALALLTRTIGVAAGVGIVLHLLVIRRAPWQRAALAGAPVFVAALGWGLWVARHRGGIDPGMATNYGSYFEVLKGAGLGVFWPSLRELPRPLGDLTLSWLPAAALYYAFAVAALAVLLYGLTLMVRRSSIGLTLFCYLAILGVWPFPVDRFVWVMLPWLGLAWCAAVLRLRQAQRAVLYRWLRRARGDRADPRRAACLPGATRCELRDDFRLRIPVGPGAERAVPELSRLVDDGQAMERRPHGIPGEPWILE